MKFFRTRKTINTEALSNTTLVSVKLSDFLHALPQKEKDNCFRTNRIEDKDLRHLTAISPETCIALVKEKQDRRETYSYLNILGTNHAIVYYYKEGYTCCHPRDQEPSISYYTFKSNCFKDEEITATVEDFCRTYNFSKEMVIILKKNPELCRAFFGLREDLKYLHLNPNKAKELGLKSFPCLLSFVTAKTKEDLASAITGTFESWFNNETYVEKMYDFNYCSSSKRLIKETISSYSLSELQTLSQFIVDALSDTSESYINTELHESIREEIITLHKEKTQKLTIERIASSCKISNNFATALDTYEVVETFHALEKFCKEYLMDDAEEIATFRGILTGTNVFEKVKVLKVIIDCFKKESDLTAETLYSALENEDFCSEFVKKLF